MPLDKIIKAAPSSTPISSPASTTSSAMTASSTSPSSASATRAGPDKAGTAGIRAACISSRWSTSTASPCPGHRRHARQGAARVARRRPARAEPASSTPIVVLAHIPLKMVDLPAMGLGDWQRRPGICLSEAVRLGHRVERAHPPSGAEGRRQGDLPDRDVNRVPAARAREPRPSPGPKLVPAGELRKWLGVREVAYTVTPTELAVTDVDLT